MNIVPENLVIEDLMKRVSRSETALTIRTYAATDERGYATATRGQAIALSQGIYHLSDLW